MLKKSHHLVRLSQLETSIWFHDFLIKRPEALGSPVLQRTQFAVNQYIAQDSRFRDVSGASGASGAIRGFSMDRHGQNFWDSKCFSWSDPLFFHVFPLYPYWNPYGFVMICMCWVPQWMRNSQPRKICSAFDLEPSPTCFRAAQPRHLWPHMPQAVPILQVNF